MPVLEGDAILTWKVGVYIIDPNMYSNFFNLDSFGGGSVYICEPENK